MTPDKGEGNVEALMMTSEALLCSVAGSRGVQLVAAATSSSGRARRQSPIVLARYMLHAFDEYLGLDLQVEKLVIRRACSIFQMLFSAQLSLAI
jgi:hypothetical protein